MLTKQESDTLREALLKVRSYLSRQTVQDSDGFCSGRAEIRDGERKHR